MREAANIMAGAPVSGHQIEREPLPWRGKSMGSRRGQSRDICSQYTGKTDENVAWKRAAGAWVCGVKEARGTDHWRMIPGSPQNIMHVILQKFS